MAEPTTARDENATVEIRASRVSPWLRRLARVSLAAAIFAGACMVVGWAESFYALCGREASNASQVALAGMAIAVLAFLAYQWLARRPANPISVIVTRSGELHLGDERVPASAFESGTVQPRRSRAGDIYQIELTRRGSPALLLRTADLGGARRLLDALGLGATAGTMTRKVMSAVNTPWLMVPVTLLVPGSVALTAVLPSLTDAIHPAPIFPVSFLIALVFLGLGLIKTRVTIGPDTITTSWMGFGRSVGIREVARIEVTRARIAAPCCVRLILKSGALFDIRVGSRGHHLFEPYSLEDECALLRERIQNAMEKAAPP